LELLFLDAKLLKFLGGMVDRVVMLSHALYFLAGTILCRVGHRMAAVTIGHELDDDRALASPRPFERHFRRAANRENVHAVDLQARDPVCAATAIEKRLRR